MIKQVLKKSYNFVFPPIIQFSPIRSGSTLVYNILRESMPNKHILKRHKLEENQIKKHKIVATYRHPIDCLASSFKRYGLKVNETNMSNQINELKENGLDDLCKVFEEKQILKLKYEEFYNNYDHIFNNLEIYFNIKILENKRKEIKDRYNINKIISKTKHYKSFNEFDKKSQLHGNHVSNSKGAPNSYVDFFSENEIDYINNELKPHIKKLGYN